MQWCTHVIFDCIVLLAYCFHCADCCSCFSYVRDQVRLVVEHIAFRVFTVLLIFLDLTLVSIDLAKAACDASDGLEIVSHIIISLFVLEVLLRIFYMEYVFVAVGSTVLYICQMLSNFYSVAIIVRNLVYYALHSHCLVLVGSRNGYEHDFTIKFKKNWEPYERLTLLSNN